VRRPSRRIVVVEKGPDLVESVTEDFTLFERGVD
jgi:hypothetical protein